MVGLSSSSLSLGSHREFCHLIHKADEAHRWFSVATHEARQLELYLNAAKVALAASKGETAAAQAATADAQAHIIGKGFPCLDIWMDAYNL